MGKRHLAFVGLLAMAPATGALAQGILWGNSAQYTAPANIESFNKLTGARTNQFAGASGNGRGVVVVGNTVYYTMVGENRIHKMNATTGADLGSISTTVASMSTIAWDGSQFWTSDYSGTNKAFRINTSGTVTSTITLSLANNYMDGMEYFNGKLIANRDDGGSIYDIYDLSGALITAGFINAGSTSTGIAFDGTNFYVSRIYNDAIGVYNGTTGAFIQDIALTPGSGRLIEDLSVDYETRIDTQSTPEPASMVLLGTGLMAVGFVTRIRRRRESTRAA
ncbi:hypothetical protein BH09GEM1_BH09GEM1_04960 [soil metagenome]